MSVQRRPGGRWQARWLVDGRQVAATFDRRRDAVEWEAGQRLRGQLGAHGAGRPSRETLEVWLRTWWARESPRWARSTRLQRAGVVDRWIVPYAGGVRLSDLGVARVSEWRAAIVAAGCPPTTANASLSVLSAALGVAVAHGALPSNPCTPVRRLPVAVTRPRALSPDELVHIGGELPTPRDVAMWSLMALAGLRPGEALGLTWASVLPGLLIVDRAVSEGELRQTKTNRRRTVEVIAPLAEDLERARPRAHAPGDLVAPGERGQPLDIRNWSQRVFRPAGARAGVQATPYDGRHTCASLLIAEGRSVAYVAAALGHASATTTLDHYAHLIDAANLAPRTPMAEAVAEARARLREGCAADNVRVLRASRRRPKPAG